MEEKRVKQKKTGLIWGVVAAVLVCTAAAVLLATVRIGTRLYRRAETIDARAEELSAAEYEAAAAKLPGSVIRWSVPIGPERFDSFSERLTLSSLPEADLEMLRYFPDLKTIDAEGCRDYASLAEIAAERPQLAVRWHVESADGPLDGNAETLAVEKISYEELETLFGLLPRLRALDLRRSALSLPEIDALAAAHPEAEILYSVPLWGQTLSSDCGSLSLPEGASGELGELEDALVRLRSLEHADLRGAVFTLGELAELLPLCPEDTRFFVPLCGELYGSDTEEIDLSGVRFSDTSELEAAVELLPALKKVVMCDCGIPNEEMAALNERHEGVRFVWTVRFSVYTLRTDATFFCASDLPSHGYVAPSASSETLQPLQYCTDLIALDLGHMFFRDLSFLEGLTQLKYLILVEERFRDISVIGTLENLEYLEIFNNYINDISPLLNCKKLRHLNVGYTRGYDPAPLWEMTWLERLWYPGNRLGWDLCEDLAASLPDTLCYLPSYDEAGSTGGGWRTDEAYYEMRNIFGMFYQPGGTGVDKDG